jgi:branched-chain amino acid transport system ATP-binding protein
MALLELRGVTKYFGGLAAVSDVDMDVKEGEIRALIGPNGSGKTTLYNLVTGFYPVTRGNISYDGKDITGLTPHQIAERGLVRTFQATDVLFADHTVLQGMMVARHLQAGMNFARKFFGAAGRIEEENQRKCLEIIDFFGLTKLKDELAINLPHGHQRALGVALTMATEPKLLMLDEPVTGMNPVETEHFMELIKEIRDQGTTVLLVEHDMKAVMGISDRITVLDFGKKIAEGTPKQIAENKDVIEAYLGAGEFAA